MKPKFLLLLLFCNIAVTARAQNHQSDLLNIGDPAPPLRVQDWIKGTPIQHFEKGKVYVVDFWAAWCRPCNAAMPYLSALADKYKGKVNFLVVDIWEDKKTPKTSMEQIKSFVDSMGTGWTFQ